MSEERLYRVTERPPIPRADGRISFVDLNSVQRSVFLHALRLRKGLQLKVLNALWIGWWSYGRLSSPIRVTHLELQEITQMGAHKHGAVLKELAELGFIDYRPGSSTARTPSEITLRIPEGWEGGKSMNSLIDKPLLPEDQSSFDLDGHDSSGTHGGVDQDGWEDRLVGGAEETTKVPETGTFEPRRSLFRGPSGLKGPQIGDLKDPKTGDPIREEREVGKEREVRNGEPPSHDREAVAPDGVTLQTICGDSQITPADVITLLIGCLAPEGRKRFYHSRQVELRTAIEDFEESAPTTKPSELLYLVGHWAGARALANANFAADHMLRHHRQGIAPVEMLDSMTTREAISMGMQAGSAVRPGAEHPVSNAG